MPGIHAITGDPLDGFAHLKQSIRDILTTPMGSRVMRREYGSRLFDLLDSPTNRPTLAAIYASTAAALRRWEPRFSIESVTLDEAAAGRIRLTVAGKFLVDGQAANASITVEIAR